MFYAVLYPEKLTLEAIVFLFWLMLFSLDFVRFIFYIHLFMFEIEAIGRAHFISQFTDLFHLLYLFLEEF